MEIIQVALLWSFTGFTILIAILAFLYYKSKKYTEAIKDSFSAIEKFDTEIFFHKLDTIFHLFYVNNVFLNNFASMRIERSIKKKSQILVLIEGTYLDFYNFQLS